jgi:hypothetical protein
VTEQLSDDDLATMFERCSNAGRWGPDDEQGTLNFITPNKRRAAAALVQTGEIVSAARVLSTLQTKTTPRPVSHIMLYTPGRGVSGDWFSVASHGMTITHMDALRHFSWEDQLYNGHRASDHFTATGVTWGSITAQSLGIFTRSRCFTCSIPSSCLETRRSGCSAAPYARSLSGRRSTLRGRQLSHEVHPRVTRHRQRESGAVDAPDERRMELTGHRLTSQFHVDDQLCAIARVAPGQQSLELRRSGVYRPGWPRLLRDRPGEAEGRLRGDQRLRSRSVIHAADQHQSNHVADDAEVHGVEFLMHIGVLNFTNAYLDP